MFNTCHALINLFKLCNCVNHPQKMFFKIEVAFYPDDLWWEFLHIGNVPRIK